MISRAANSQPRPSANLRPISMPRLPAVSEMATMLITHLLSRVNARNTNAPASHRVADEGSEGLSRRLIRGHVASLERALDRRSSAQSRSRRNGCQGDAPATPRGDAPASPHLSASGPAVCAGRSPPAGRYSGGYPRRWHGGRHPRLSALAATPPFHPPLRAARQAPLRSTTERPGEEVAETLPDLRRHLDPIVLRRQLRRPRVGGQVGATRCAFAQVRF